MMVAEKKEYCCGCTACKSICQVHAITMKPDEEGFLYPDIDETLCTHCGACKSVCNFNNGYSTAHYLENPTVYGIKNKDEAVRKNSRSGGVFTAITEYILQNGGSVYGAAFDEHFDVEHKCAINTEERNSFRGSKYVQSDLLDTFIEIKTKLMGGELVLFSGTACQTSGLTGFLVKSYDNLILCDLVCHGVPSPKVWKDYKEYMQKKYHGKIEDAQFRCKDKFGWHEHIESVQIKGRIHYTKCYRELFYSNQVLRPSCYNCIYTNLQRPSDFTLADYWGLKREEGFDDNKGVSLLFINSKKAERIFSFISDSLIIKPCVDKNFVHPNLKSPTEKPHDREKFWNDYSEKGFEYILLNYTENQIKSKIKILVKLNSYYLTSRRTISGSKS